MRKTIIALILVIPMVFVLVVFSSVKLVALSVDISANGIRIYAENAENGTLYVNMSEEREYTVTAEVMPENAKNRGYKLSSADPSVVDVTEEGKLILKREGTVDITATSDDMGYTDSLSVVVAATGPYDLSFSLFRDGGEDLLTEGEGGYGAELETGRYRYAVSILPAEYMEYTITPHEGTTAVIDEGAHTILFPFSGEAGLTVTVPGLNGNVLRKDVTLGVTRPREGILVNGAAGGNTVKLAQGARSATLYLECDKWPTFECDHATAETVQLGTHRYRLDITLEEVSEERLTAQITSDKQSAEVVFSFAEFDYSISSDLTIESEEGTPSTAVVVGNAYRFYAVSDVAGADITYEWTLNGGKEYLTVSENTASCTVKIGQAGDYTLRVAARRGGEPIGDEHTVTVHAVENIGAVRIDNNVNADLAEAYTIAGYAYDASLKAIKQNYILNTFTFTPGKAQPLVKAGEEIVYTVSNPTVAKVEVIEGNVNVIPLGEGRVTVTAEWRWNKAFKKNLRTSLVLNVIADAVSVTSAPEYTKAMEEGRVTVLKNDISLGTDQNGTVYDDGVLENILQTHRMKSTYNIEWYKHTDLVTGGMDLHEEDAYISYVSEITNDLYGNGFSIDADAFTHALDGTGQARFKSYRGPLYFVAYKDTATVAGQDNCAFLIRKDGIRLYGVNLLGCKDSSLLSEGSYDLTQLNLVGTTLEVNADCEIINCRIRNGRNVVRTYGGNRDGNGYFVSQTTVDAVTDKDRILVRIEGCILSQGREFILKMGANRALQANTVNGAEPQLRDKDKKAYTINGKSNWYGDLLKDQYFYDHYVMTDVTLKDSVLETSGFFTVGIESNFAGTFLYNGTRGHDYRYFTKSWEYSGGTSYASVLRLEGDVRLYDWKDVSLVDSSTLIESPIGALSAWLKLDVAKMLDFVYNTDPAAYKNVFAVQNGKKFVHGGIAFYGGGRNYSQLDISGLTGTYKSFEHYQINISVLSGAEDATMKNQGDILPSAAGTNDFNFFMYSANGTAGYSAQLADSAAGIKYKGIQPVPAF